MTQVRLGVCLLAFLATPLRAQDAPNRIILSGESRAAAQSIADVRKNIAEKKWSEALDQLQALIDKGSDDLVPLDAQQTLQARRLAHVLIASLPPDVLEQYRQRSDGATEPLLKQSLEQRDARGLRAIVEEAFCSRPAEKALDALGELAFERGDFDEAESLWRLLLPADPSSSDLRYPQPTLDPARLRAKILLARLFRDGASCVTPELRAYAELHGKAEGSLAGRTGKYADVVRGVAETVPAARDLPWSTFGGAANRGLVVPTPANVSDRLGQLCQKPRFRFSLGEAATTRSATATQIARSLAFHPVIAGGHVLVADARFVTGYDLRTGTSSQWYDAARDNGGIKPDLQLPAPADLRYTLTVADDCVYARLGEQAIQNVEDGQPLPEKRPRNKPESLLVCLSFQPGPGGDRLRWQARPAVANENAVFEGAPLVKDGQVYVASTRFVQGRAITAIHCYSGNNGAVRWRKDVCESRDVQPEDKRYRHHLLTQADTRVVYCSHTGAVVALDATTGKRAWAVRYPQRSAPLRVDDPPPLTDLCPCLYAGGAVYVAPTDSDRLFCLDAASGRILWEKKEFPVVCLLGISRAVPGKPLLILTRPDGLQAISAADGSNDGGWSKRDIVTNPPLASRLLPMGRGLLLGDLVLWSLQGKVLLLRQVDGEIADNPTLLANVRGGNLAFGQGCLAVADRLHLTIFTPPAWQMTEREREARRQPTSVEALLALGQSQADAGNFADVLATLDQADVQLEQTSKPTLRQQVVQVRHRTLLELALLRSPDEADALLRQAAEGRFPVPLRLRALKRRIDLAQHRGDFGRQAAIWQSILAEAALREQTWIDGLSISAVEARDQLARLRRTHGAGLFVEQEKAAQESLTACKALPLPARQEKLEQLVESAPDTAAARKALWELARDSREAAVSAHAFRQLLRGENSPAEEVEAMNGLARAHERQHCWEAARSVWRQLEHRHGDQRLDPAGQTVKEQVALRLRSPDYAAPEGGNGGHLPLARAWNRSLHPGEVLLPTGGMDRIFTARTESNQGSLGCYQASNGEPRWQCPLAFVPTWVGRHADLVLTAGPGGLACVRREDGRRTWQVQWESSAAHGFKLQSGRLDVMQGDWRFLVYDAETGRLLWSRLAPAGTLGPVVPEGRFHPNYRVLDDTVLLQTATGRRWLCDAVTGRLLHDAPTDRVAWPDLAGSSPCLVREGGRIVRLDPANGNVTWSWALPGPSQLTGEPVQLRVTSGGVLVLTPVNRGQSLQRLDTATGKPLWDREVFPAADFLDLTAWSVDDRAIYLVREQKLLALSIENGKVLWEQTLSGPQGRWRTALAPGGSRGDVLLVCPDAIPERVCKITWLFGSLQWIVSDRLEALAGQGCPIHCCDPATGQVNERLNLPAGNVPRRTSLTWSLAWPEGVQPRLTARQTLNASLLSLHVGPGALAAGLGGQLWGFRPMTD